MIYRINARRVYFFQINVVYKTPMSFYSFKLLGHLTDENCVTTGMYQFARELLSKTLPPAAIKTLRETYRGIGDGNPQWLNRLEEKMHLYASETRNPLGISLPTHPFHYEHRCIEFCDKLGELLDSVGSRVNLHNFDPKPLLDESIHDGLASAARKVGITIEHGYCDSVSIKLGRAIPIQSHVLRLSKGSTFMDVQDGGDTFHVIRAIAMCKDISTVRKFERFTQMIRLLLRTTTLVSGKPACSNDGCMAMADGGWRFVNQKSVWGFEVSRLTRFWLAMGGIPSILIGDERPLVVFYRIDRALKFAEDYKRVNPDKPSPFHYASRFGIYSKEELLKLKS